MSVKSRLTAKQAKVKTGRPSEYSDELATSICEQIAAGKSLRSICKVAGMPSAEAVRKWLLKGHDEFVGQYARAREDQADTLADQMLDIADDDVLDANDKRVRVDTRKWLAGKLRPKKYGEKLELAGDPLNPVILNAIIVPAKSA